MSKAPPRPALLDVPAVAEVLDVSARTVWRLIADKQIAIHRIGRSVKISAPDLETYLTTQRQ